MEKERFTSGKERENRIGTSFRKGVRIARRVSARTPIVRKAREDFEPGRDAANRFGAHTGLSTLRLSSGAAECGKDAVRKRAVRAHVEDRKEIRAIIACECHQKIFGEIRIVAGDRIRA